MTPLMLFISVLLLLVLSGFVGGFSLATIVHYLREMLRTVHI